MKKSVRIRKMGNSGGVFPWPWNTIFLAICIVAVMEKLNYKIQRSVSIMICCHVLLTKGEKL